ncbi:MAG: hypothetical protein RMK32_09605 [Anaerolineae bacterium]|nr:hypothetical protein [Thermoflexus sp.]MDW8065869.1 hypothetical protein [Anaerolineae bacterium]
MYPSSTAESGYPVCFALLDFPGGEELSIRGFAIGGAVPVDKARHRVPVTAVDDPRVAHREFLESVLLHRLS